MTTEPVQYAAPSRKKKLNVRLIVFLAVVTAPFAWFTYVFLNQTLTGGIIHHGNYTSVDLKAMGNFPFDGINGQLTDIPERYRNLDGKKVELEGFMWAGNSASSEVNRFEFVYNISKCCFNGPPLVQERVFAHGPQQRRRSLLRLPLSPHRHPARQGHQRRRQDPGSLPPRG